MTINVGEARRLFFSPTGYLIIRSNCAPKQQSNLIKHPFDVATRGLQILTLLP